jgi:hypothetical protein
MDSPMRHPFFLAIRRSSIVLTALVAISTTGCGLTSNRWAMSDPVYFVKHHDASDNSLPAKLVRLSDASHVSGRQGSEFGFSGGSQYGSGDFSGFKYVNSMVESRIGLVGLVGGTNDPDERIVRALGGVHLGYRLQTPTRLAPFVGVGAFAGAGDPEWLPPAKDPNEFDFHSMGEDEDEGTWILTDGQLAAYPELGFHYWITPRVRMTASGRYHITTDGADEDSWNYGVSLGFID